ncbi:unnamed protein product [Closterium sp. NIES-53]
MEQTDSLTERREPASCPASPVRIVRSGRRVPRQRPPLVPGTHTMALRPSSVPQHVTLPSPLASSLPDVPEPESDLVRAASPTVTRLLATVVTGPSFESAAASALVAACRLDYAASLVAKSEFVCLPSVGGECALGTDVLEVRQEDIESLAAAIPQLVAMLLCAEGDLDALDILTSPSYAEAISIPPLGANIVDGMWIFRLKWSPGSPPVFKARYVARGFSQQLGVDFFQTFSTITKMTTLQLPLHVSAQRDYGLHSLDFSTALLQGSVHEEIWLRRPPGFTGLFPPGSQRNTLVALGFAPSTVDPSLFLRTDTSLPPFYILVYVDELVFATADTEALALVNLELQKRHTCTDLGELRSYLGLQITRDRARRTITLTQSHMVQQVLQRFGFTWSSSQSTPLASGHSLSAPPSDESVEPTGPYSELVGCLMYLMTCTRPDLVYPLGLLARYVAPNRHRKVHWDAAKRVLRYLCSTSSMGLVLGGRGLVVLTGHSDASWVDGLATQQSSQGYTFSLGYGSISWRSTRSSSVLSSSNKATIALCQEHRLEHRTKHIALRYFLARELQQRGQLRVAYVATRANTANIFTKALPPSDHQHASWVDDQATQRSSQGYTFSLGSGSVSWRSTRSFSVLSSSCEAEIYATAMAAQELRWLTYLLTDLGERPSSPPVRTKHIALRYFLARELQQRGQLCLRYVATRANTTDIFTKALQPACLVFLDWSCDPLLSPTLPMGHPQTLGAPCATHEATGAKGSHESVAAAGVPAAQLCLFQLHLRRRHLRLLHPSRHRHRRLHLHHRHRSPHLDHHPHPHPLLRLRRHYRRPHHLLQLPCPAYPC